MYEQRRPDVAVFIDFENVYVSVRDKLNANPNFEAIMDRCSDLGRVVISRAYADWYRYPRVTSALYANAIEPIYVATYYYDKDVGRTGRAIKNSVDMNLCIDAMKTLFTNPNIGRFVLVTGDRDFIPLVNSIRQQGKEVYIIGIGGAASTHLAQSADEFVFYEQLVGKQPGGSAAATAIANRATELNRGLEPATEAPPQPREREAPP
ncbi:MAG TPA: NYN domain-containing protein, partial [Chloroflexaceae bacterium]|nr:NYN domain-containing protein [Chloroflexaceae bacterium]